MTETSATFQTLLADQQDRWRRGERVNVESYLERTPALGDSRDDLLDLIYHEILLRERYGESPSFDEYSRRFPVLTDDLRVQFEVHAGLGDREPTRKRLPRIPGCTVQRRIGCGGVGVVYLARQESLGRTVAVKVIRDWATADAADLSRFRAEAEAAARVNHPNVVQIYEVGERKGCPFLIMEYVSGGSLDRRLRGRPLAARTAAELVNTLALAVEHLHRQGIIHCDLKPANVLLAPADAGGVNLAVLGDAPECFVPKVADFGFARRMGADLTSRSGGAFGTPQYMAPEQIDGPANLIAPPTDVHALGVLLYEFLVGRPPYLGEDLLAVFRQVLQHEPVPPSRMQPGVPRDLETICLKCLQNDPARRYPSAAALADDLHRYLAGRPVTARPVSAVERAARWARRNPWVAGLTGALAATVVLGFTLVTAKMLEARQERNDKEQARQDEQRRADELGVALNDLESVAHRMRIVAADRELQSGNTSAANRILDDCRPALRSFDWFQRKQAARGSRRTLRTDQHQGSRLAVSHDGRKMAIAGSGRIAFFDISTGVLLRTLPAGPADSIRYPALAFSPNGKRLAVAQVDKTLHLWNLETGADEWSHPIERGTFDLAFPSDAEVMTAGERWIDPKNPPTEKFKIVAEFKTWDAGSGKLLRMVEGPTLSAANHGALSRDGRRFVAWSTYAHDLYATPPVPVMMCDTTGGQSIATFADHVSQVQVATLSPDGSRVAVADRHTIRVRSTIDGTLRLTLRTPARDTYSITFSDDGERLATSGEDQTVRVWEVGTGRELGAYRGHDAPVTQVRFLPGGRGLTSCGNDGTARVWDANPPGAAVRLESTGRQLVAADAMGRFVAVASSEVGTVRVFDPENVAKGRVIRTVAMEIAMSPNGTSLACCTPVTRELLAAGTCGTRLFDPAEGKEIRFIPGLTAPLAYSADGRTLVGTQVSVVNKSPANLDGDLDRTTLVVCDAATGQERLTLPGHTQRVISIILFPDTTRMVTYDNTEEILWDLETRAPLRRTRTAHEALPHPALRPDGRQMAAVGANRAIEICDPATGEIVHNLPLAATATAMAYSLDSRLLAAGCDDGTVRLWDVHSGQWLLTLTDARQPIRSLTFNGTHRLLAATQSIGPASEVLIWEGYRPANSLTK